MPRMIELGTIGLVSGVSVFTGKGFVRVAVLDQDNKQVAVGQMSPEEVRTMALGWLGAAEAAESDAAVFAELKGIGLDDTACAGFLAALRERRDEEEETGAG